VPGDRRRLQIEDAGIVGRELIGIVMGLHPTSLSGVCQARIASMAR
jgi:hypothetical protein